MTKWWLELYTIPALKSIARAAGIVLVCNLVLGLLSKKLLFFGPFLNAFILWEALKAHTHTVSTNIEFHKIHIPFAELRRAFILSPLMSFIVICFAGWGNLIVAGFLADWALDEILFHCFFYLGIIVYGCSLRVMQQANRSATYQVLDKKYPSKLRLICFCVVVVIGFLFLMSVATELYFNPFYIMVATISGLLLSRQWYYFRAVFHQAPRVGNIRNVLRYSLRGLGATALLYGLLMAGTRPLIHSPSLAGEMKSYFYELNGILAPELDVASARQLLRVNQMSPEVIDQIFATSPNLSLVPVTELYPKPRALDYYYYATYVLNPTPENLTFILERTQKVPKYLAVHEATSQMIGKRWPKHVAFPEHLAVKRTVVEKERLPASGP